jgi:phosphatidylserine decarboxylase
MTPIPYLDRKSGKIQYEKVFKGKALSYLYSKPDRCLLADLFSKNPIFSRFMGWWQKQMWTAKNIIPFIEEYGVDASEFLEPIASFSSFNDFFIRKLKAQARPIAASRAIIPADGRYWFYDKIETGMELFVKGKPFNLERLFQNPELAQRYRGGSLVLARLCPSDYHRFHFPIDCIPGKSRLINGPLYSVNPIAVKQNLAYLTENKRKLTLLESEPFGQVAYFDVGATTCGSIVETFSPGKPAGKGDEKGYFEFGGSALILLFEPGKIAFSEDLLAAKTTEMEIRCLLGQEMGI